MPHPPWDWSRIPMTKVSIKLTTFTATCCQGQWKRYHFKLDVSVKYKLEKQRHGNDCGSIRLFVLAKRKETSRFLVVVMAHLNRRLYSSCEWKKEHCRSGHGMDRQSSQPGSADRKAVWVLQEISGWKTWPAPRFWELLWPVVIHTRWVFG